MKIQTLTLSLILLLWGIGSDVLYGNTRDFGKVDLTIDALPAQSLVINRALLYRNVNIHYDSTVIIQNSAGMEVLYYPQLEEGKENVLRLILDRKSDSVKDFYDMYFNLGDSIPDSLYWNGAAGKIFLAHNGEARPLRPRSRDIRGSIEIVDGDHNRAVTGRLDLNFQMPVLADDTVASRVALKGAFDVPVGKFQETSIGTVSEKKGKSSTYKRNLYLAIIGSVFLIAVFGLR